MVALAGWAACCHAVHHHANMQVEGKGYSFRNTASSQLSDEFNLPCQTVDSSQGKGNMMVWGKADWDLGLTGRGGTQRNATQRNAMPAAHSTVCTATATLCVRIAHRSHHHCTRFHAEHLWVCDGVLCMRHLNLSRESLT
jgi:hypothetical protein